MTREEAKRILYVYRAVNLVDASHREAFDMSIEALEQKWIPVSERLPEDEEEVLCFLESEEMAVLFRRNDWGQYEWVDGGVATGSYDVVAWMPLPKPYKAEGSEE